MFYLSKTKIVQRHDNFLVRLLPASMVFLILLGVTLVGWRTSKHTVIDEQVKVLQRTNTDMSLLLKQRMESYSAILEGGAGLFNASDSVTRTEWDSYFKSYHLTEEFPGLQSVGFATVVQPDSPDQSGQHTSILYIEPNTSPNMAALGYDMYNDPVRKSAMDAASASGQVTVSNLTTMSRHIGDYSGQLGFLMYKPVYKHASQLNSPAERQAALIGYIFAPFQITQLIDTGFPKQDQNFAFRLYSNESTGKKLAYQSPNYPALSRDPNRQIQSNQLNFSSRIWELEGVVVPAIVSSNSRNRPPLILYGGLALSAFITAILYLLLVNRSQMLKSIEEKNIQTAKDELLALASHQLRTPATGVKQYVGMLREGFAGKVSPIQKRLLDKAYESNERQLGTINEMLFVARSDADNLKMDRSSINLGTMVKEIAEEHASSMSQRNQKQHIKVPKRALTIKGDRQYLRMALENIVSNAIKYTPDNGSIYISLSKRANKAIFTVRDTGVGVSKQDQNLLFKKFSRVPNELTNKVSGSGIGLYLAKKVVDSHEGTIEFNSDGDSGSTVVITLKIL